MRFERPHYTLSFTILRRMFKTKKEFNEFIDKYMEEKKKMIIEKIDNLKLTT